MSRTVASNGVCMKTYGKDPVIMLKIEGLEGSILLPRLSFIIPTFSSPAEDYNNFPDLNLVLSLHLEWNA